MTQRKLTCLMYHDVRDPSQTPYPARYALRSFLPVARFAEQLDYIQRHYSVISIRQLTEALVAGADLPSRPLLLTFDDGLVDHYANVVPLLEAKGMPGAFFLPARAVAERKVMDVHKIQFVLAAAPEKEVIELVFSELDCLRSAEVPLATNQSLWVQLSASTWGPANWWSPEMIFVTRLLRDHLPRDFARRLIDRLFERLVTRDEAAFGDNFYLSMSQARRMLAAGMEIGGHGYDSLNLAAADPETRAAEIQGSAAFLSRLVDGPDGKKGLAFSYPNGGYNAEVRHQLGQHGFQVAFTTQQRLESEFRDLLALPRIDAPQQFPFGADAPLSYWTTDAS